MAERIEDMLAIGQAMAAYCRGIDRLDPALTENAFWPESHSDYGIVKGSRDEIVTWAMRDMRSHFNVTSHALNQSYYEFRGDQAAVETQFAVRSWGSGEAAAMFGVLSGRYVDLFEKRDGEWRILNRTVIYDCAGMTDAMPLAFPHVEGSRSQSDPSYHVFEAVNGTLPAATS